MSAPLSISSAKRSPRVLIVRYLHASAECTKTTTVEDCARARIPSTEESKKLEFALAHSEVLLGLLRSSTPFSASADKPLAPISTFPEASASASSSSVSAASATLTSAPPGSVRYSRTAQYTSLLPDGFALVRGQQAPIQPGKSSKRGPRRPARQAAGYGIRGSWTVVDAAAHGLSRACMGGRGSVHSLRSELVDSRRTTRLFEGQSALLYVVRDVDGAWDTFATTYNGMARSAREALFRRNPSADLWSMLPPETFPFEKLVWFRGSEARAAWMGESRSSIWRTLSAGLREDVRNALLLVAREKEQEQEQEQKKARAGGQDAKKADAASAEADTVAITESKTQETDDSHSQQKGTAHKHDNKNKKARYAGAPAS